MGQLNIVLKAGGSRASLIDPIAGGKQIAENIKKFDAGKPIAGLVPQGRGY